ncbi:hypothetical protein M427DRAFT_26723 [Gonapodya prolifera JEL478]|uniref:Uncharacterized protein n=1 Tax=Gonapodya prolifera (strain JEL478) TaxID=1344416 RepID=A0A139AZ77_GONPJ|nr:hypothetical protein M427DRAFT_26723 [Gonapodya prolifera JEL478]|eukprot:KXS22062.1 hypothetical protein M427DRAFT_26723 [Gonapodya prolifera JEL478]
MQSDAQLADSSHRLLATLLVRTIPLCDASLNRALARLDALTNLYDQMASIMGTLRFTETGARDGEKRDAGLEMLVSQFPNLLTRLLGKVRLSVERTAWTLLSDDLGLQGGVDAPGLVSNPSEAPPEERDDVQEHQIEDVNGGEGAEESPSPSRRTARPHSSARPNSDSKSAATASRSSALSARPTASSTSTDLPSLAHLHARLLNIHRRALPLLRRAQDTSSPAMYSGPTSIDPVDSLTWTIAIASHEATRIHEKVELARLAVQGCFGVGQGHGSKDSSQGNKSNTGKLKTHRLGHVSEDSSHGNNGNADKLKTHRSPSPSPSLSSDSTSTSSASSNPFDYSALRLQFTEPRAPDLATLLEYARDRYRVMEKGAALERAGVI